jgi:predicted HicB family RNase H-like nuclease
MAAEAKAEGGRMIGEGAKRIERKATSIKVDPELWEEAKIAAIRQKENLYDLFERALRKELDVLKQKV